MDNRNFELPDEYLYPSNEREEFEAMIADAGQEIRERGETIITLRQQLAATEAERTKAFEDAASWRRLYTEQVGELAQMRAERDTARAAAASWRRLYTARYNA